MSLLRSSRPHRRTALLLVPAVIAAALLLPRSEASAVDPVAGGQTTPDAMFPNVGNSGYDVAHYDLDIAWTPTGTTITPGTPPVVAVDGTVEASVAIQAATTGAPLSEFSLDFEGSGLTVSAITVDGVPATWTRDEQPSIIRHKLIVTPATPVSGAFTTVVTYAGKPTRHIDLDGSWEGWNVTTDGVIALNQPIGAMTYFPHNNKPSDKATYTVDLDIPDTITNTAGAGAAAAVSNGELVEKVVSGPGRTTWRWAQTKPMASELMVVSIGKYDVLESDITLSDGRVIHEWTFVDSALSAANKTTISNRRPAIGTITRGLEQIFGPYPGDSTGAIIDTVPSGINYALETQDRSFFPSASSFNGGTLTHELAHQWYGDAVSPVIWTDIWINEGMGTWAPTYYNNVLASPPTSTNSTHAQYYNSWNASASTSANWTTPPGSQTTSANLYGYQTYTRGAQVYEALKLSIGDTAYFAFLKQWQSRFGGGNGGLAEFRALAEELSGRDLGAFFQDWILDADKPAWPQRYDVGLTVAPGTPVAPGETLTYTLTAANRGRVALSPAGGIASVAAVDLSDVLDDATIDPDTLPAGLSLDGTTLTWTVPTTAVATFVPTGAATPSTSPTSTVDFSVVVKPAASLDTLAATARSVTLGGFCAASGCTTSSSVPIQPVTPSADPVVSGTPRVGSLLAADTTGWADDTTFDYQWSVGGTPVDGATAATFTPRPVDLDQTVTVTVTGSKTDFTPVTRTSEPSAPVELGVLTPGTPSITGTPRVAVPLTAVTGTWDSGTTFTYQWAVDGAPVDGATATTFTPRPADVGKTVTVAVTGSKDGYESATRTSAPSAPVALGNLVATPFPTVIGRPTVGEPLTVQTNTWDAGVTFAYQWRVDGAPVEGATGTTYTPVAADLGKVVTVAVTGSKDGYTSVTRVSADGPAVVAGTQDATPTPVITGTPQVAVPLGVEPGTWDEGVTLSYQWSVGGVPVEGATGTTFTPRATDVDRTVTVAVTGTRPGYSPVTQTSAPSAPVAPGVLATDTPTVTGTPQVGSPLDAAAGTWEDGAALTYQWSVDGTEVAGATGSSFTPRPADVDKAVTVAVTGSKLGYTTATETSTPTEPVALGDLVLTPVPVVSGRQQVGRLLMADAGEWDAGTTLTYLWVRNGFGIPGANAPTYTLTADDAGKIIRVVVSGSKPGYVSEFRVSERLDTVDLGRQSLRPKPRVVGTPVVRGTLRARPGQRDEGVSLAFRWYVGGIAVNGPRGAGATYRPVRADLGKKVRVQTVATKPGYATVTTRSTPTARVRR